IMSAKRRASDGGMRRCVTSVWLSRVALRMAAIAARTVSSVGHFASVQDAGSAARLARPATARSIHPRAVILLRRAMALRLYDNPPGQAPDLNRLLRLQCRDVDDGHVVGQA